MGDVLLAVDGLPVAGLSARAVYLLLIDRPVGTAARLTIERQGAQLVIDVPVEPVPPPRDEP